MCIKTVTNSSLTGSTGAGKQSILSRANKYWSTVRRYRPGYVTSTLAHCILFLEIVGLSGGIWLLRSAKPHSASLIVAIKYSVDSLNWCHGCESYRLRL